jgi:hypothetical protein
MATKTEFLNVTNKPFLILNSAILNNMATSASFEFKPVLYIFVGYKSWL